MFLRWGAVIGNLVLGLGLYCLRALWSNTGVAKHSHLGLSCAYESPSVRLVGLGAMGWSPVVPTGRYPNSFYNKNILN